MVKLVRFQADGAQRIVRLLAAGDIAGLHRQMLHVWRENLKQANDFIADLATGSARQRVARLLLRPALHEPDGVVLLLAREDVGATLGLTTETVSRAVASFRREGLLVEMDRVGRRFRIDAKSLRSLAANAS